MKRVLGREILRCVVEKSDVSLDEIRADCRQRPVMEIRHLAAYLMVRHCPWLSYSHISRLLNCTHHSVTHAYRRFPERLRANPDLEFIHDEVVKHLSLTNAKDRPHRNDLTGAVVRLPHKGRAK